MSNSQEKVEDVVSVIISSDSDKKTLFYHSEVMHMVKEGIEIHKTNILQYRARDRDYYTKEKWSNLVKLATLLDFLIPEDGTEKEWFRADTLVMDEPWFAHPSGEQRTLLVLFSSQVFVKHQCFYFPYDLKVI